MFRQLAVLLRRLMSGTCLRSQRVRLQECFNDLGRASAKLRPCCYRDVCAHLAKVTPQSCASRYPPTHPRGM